MSRPTKHIPSPTKAKTTTRRGSVAQDRYPYLSGCYVDDGFERKLTRELKLTREFLQATVEVSHYKGAMLLRVLPAPPKRGEEHRCSCPSIQYPAAWLHGDELDALIKILREAKRVWLRAYRKAAREVAKRKREAYPLIVRRRPTTERRSQQGQRAARRR